MLTAQRKDGRPSVVDGAQVPRAHVAGCVGTRVDRCVNAGRQVLSWGAVTSLGSQSLACRWAVSFCSGRCHRILQTGQPVDGRLCVSCTWSCKSKVKVLAFSVSGEPSSHWGLAWGKGEGARGLFREDTGAG